MRAAAGGSSLPAGRLAARDCEPRWDGRLHPQRPGREGARHRPVLPMPLFSAACTSVCLSNGSSLHALWSSTASAWLSCTHTSGFGSQEGASHFWCVSQPWWCTPPSISPSQSRRAHTIRIRAAGTWSSLQIRCRRTTRPPRWPPRSAPRATAQATSANCLTTGNLLHPVPL